MTDSYTADLLREVNAFRAEKGMAVTTFGRLAVNDGKLMKRLADGRITLRTAKKIRKFIADHGSK